MGLASIRLNVLSGLRWQILAKLGSQIISWSVTIFVMRLLLPADYGLMAMAMVLVGFTSLVAEMGLGAALVRSTQIDLAQQRSVFGLSLMVNSALFLFLACAAPLAVAVFHEPRLLALTLIMGLQLPIGALSVVPDSMAKRDMQFKALGVIELLVQVSTAATTLAGALLGLGVWALVAGQFAQTLVKCTLLTWHFGTVAPSFKLQGQARLVAFGGSLTANRVVWYLWSQADLFIAGRLLGPQLLGIYSVAANLANMPMQKVMAISNQVAFSAFAKLQGDRTAMSSALLRALRVVLALSVGLLWSLAGVAPELVPLLLGGKWSAAVLPLQILSAIVPLRIMTSTLSTALIAAGHVNDDLKNTVMAAILLIPGFYAGAHFGGMTGLALAWLICYPIFSVILIRQAAARFGLTMTSILHQLLNPAISGAAMLAAIAIVRAVLTGQPPPMILLCVGLAGAASYILTLWLCDRQLLQDFKELVAPSASISS